MPGVNDFVSKFQHGARSNLFRVEIPYLGEDCKFFCKSSHFPGYNIGKIPVKYQNNTVFVAGDTDFPDWSVTIINDKNFYIRKQVELWMGSIKNKSQTNGATNVKDYLKNCYIFQLDERGRETAEYIFYHMWPTDLGQIDVSFDNPDTIQEYTVSFAYSYWEMGQSVKDVFKDTIESVKNDVRSLFRF